MQTHRIIVLGFFLLLATFTKAQDTLQLVKNAEILVVKVTEIGIDEIKYLPWGANEAPIIVLEKSKVRKIILANGTVINFFSDPLQISETDERAREKTHVIKFQFFSPLYYSLAFGYETVLKKGMNLEGKIGLIGVGLGDGRPNASGVYFKAGPKFWTGKDYYYRGERRSHPLRGAYIKPELIYNHFWQDQTVNTVKKRITYDNLAFNIIFGKQYLLGDILTLDWYFGMGYGYQHSSYKADPNLNSTDYNDLEFEPYAYSHVYLGKNFPMTLTGGLTLGIMF
ncbi:hypothetical protein BH11BAC2_BH11BAC2_00190 [soil metagenome]